jgi:6-pyruvoyltetrahydropterin/6-carboxytetrahydropterin synthase
MKWKLEKEFSFEASHQLPRHEGKCKRLHGHSWKGRLICEASELQSTGSSSGMVVDFSLLSEIMRPLLADFLDHHHLNETLKLENPTVEEVARWVFGQVKPRLPQLTAVVIDETCTSRCEFRE